MVVLFALVVFWIFVTVFGHLTWITIAAIFRALTREDLARIQLAERTSDLAAARRVVMRLAERKLIVPSEANRLRQKVDELAGLNSPAANPTLVRPLAPSSAASAPSSSSSSGHSAGQVRTAKTSPAPTTSARTPLSKPQSSTTQHQIPTRLHSATQAGSSLQTSGEQGDGTRPLRSLSPRIAAETIGPTDAKESTKSPRPERIRESVGAPAIGGKARAGKTIAEFLADHNIRWGELIAGLLIVVCSIGLVVSLWSTITQMHRVVPSLIFLAGNAAIFGAGLYTLFRWKLQDTSRATLLIAMLLVPLGILTGLSTGGVESSSVQLSDPITIGCILSVGSVYLVLIWQAARALVGRKDSLAMTVSIAGPAAFLPLVPAAIRTWGPGAGYLMYGASATIAISALLLSRFKPIRRGNAIGRGSLVVLVGAFSLAVLTFYLGFMTREIEQSWLRLAIASIPGVVILASSCGSISSDRTRPKLALCGTVAQWLGLFAAATILVPAMMSSGWLWSWAITFSIAAAIAAYAHRGKTMVLAATLPVSLATVLCSPMLLGGLVWEEIPVLRRLFGGEPMIVSLGISVALLFVTQVFRKTEYCKPLSIAGITWAAYAVVQAGLLTICPTSMLGVVPPWIVSALLGLASIATLYSLTMIDRLDWAGLSESLTSIAVTAVLAAFWVSLLRPLQVFDFQLDVARMGWTLLAAGIGSMVAGELRVRRRDVAVGLRNNASFLLLMASVVATGVLVHAAVAHDNWIHESRVAICVLLPSVVSWFWIGLTDQKQIQFVLSRVFLVVTSVVIGHHFFAESLFSRVSLINGTFLWSWAALSFAVVGTILIRDLFLINLRKTGNSDVASPSIASPICKRVQWYDLNANSWDRISLSTTIHCATWLVMLAGLYSFGRLVLRVSFEQEWIADVGLLLPACVAIAGTALLTLTSRVRKEFIASSKTLWCGLNLGILTWLGWQIAIRTVIDPSTQLILATSVVTLGCFAVDLLGDSKTPRKSSWLPQAPMTSIGLALIAISSISLLASSWLPSVIQSQVPAPFVTWSVSVWCVAGAVTSGWMAIRRRSERMGGISAFLTPTVVVLLMPLSVPEQWWIWIQTAGIASGFYALLFVGRRSRSQTAIGVSALIATSLGISTCVFLIAAIVADQANWLELSNTSGVFVSILGCGILVNWNRIVGPNLQSSLEFSWPSVVSLLSGHICLSFYQPFAHWMSCEQLLAAVWITIAFVSLAESFRLARLNSGLARFNRWHVGVLVLAVCGLGLIGPSAWHHEVVCLLATGVAGLLAISTSHSVRLRIKDDRNISDDRFSPTLGTLLTNRSVCWFAIVIGVFFIVRLGGTLGGSVFATWTGVTAWVASWTIIWRVSQPDDDATSHPTNVNLFADFGSALVVLGMILFELIVVQLAPIEFVELAATSDALLWQRVFMALAVGCTICFRRSRKGAVETSTALILATITLVCVRISFDHAERNSTWVAIDCLAPTIAFSILVFASQSISKFTAVVGSIWNKEAPNNVIGWHHQFASELLRVHFVLLPIVLCVCLCLLIECNTAKIVPLAICSLAVLAFTTAELADKTGRHRLRVLSIVTMLVSIAYWGATHIVDESLPLWFLATRWFVGSVFLAMGFAFAAPKLLGAVTLDRWSPALRTGLWLVLGFSSLSLLTLLACEGIVRVSGTTDLLVKPMFLGTAATLAALTVMSTLSAVLSGPGYSYRETWQLSDRQRAGLVVAAQMFGGLTWFHLFLCESPLANLGLRAYWPYIVMVLSFVSVGITEWARRRNDRVLCKTLRQTSLFLPLVPIIGFWMSGAWVASLFGQSNADGWSYIQGRVSYQALLITAALYYGVVSFLWKSSRARLVSILIGNGALWIILIQTPNWDFLSHPQAWLIPPAVCVLIATYLHREQLGKEATVAIRYAATLVIYVSSTADMLLQGIGETLFGPMVLVVLALLGAAAGIAFRVKPFLYLGTSFVFIGVTSMVWHAQQQIDQVWPWWAFGISTGVLLMVGLMAIEKNKPRLKQLAHSMQQWET